MSPAALPLLALPAAAAAEPAGTAGTAGEAPEFKPFMARHAFEGCPGNSVCSRETGRLRKRWGELLDGGGRKALGDFVARHGVPVGVWTTSKEPRADGTVVWDSPCPNHRRGGGSPGIYDGEAFVKRLGAASRRRGLIEHRALVAVGGRRVAFPMPRGETPLLLKGGRLHFTGEHEGRYYGISLGADGAVSFEGVPGAGGAPAARASRSAACPGDLAKAFAEAAAGEDGLYAGSRCREVWDADRGAWAPMVHGVACP